MDMLVSSQPSDTGVQPEGTSTPSKDAPDAILSVAFSRFWAAILGRVPVGYEDETGFHFGVKMPSRGTGVGAWAENQSGQTKNQP